MVVFKNSHYVEQNSLAWVALNSLRMMSLMYQHVDLYLYYLFSFTVNYMVTHKSQRLV